MIGTGAVARNAAPLLDDEGVTSWRLDGRDMPPAPAGATITDALLRAEDLVLSRSAKYRRPRGAYCLTGDCGSCLVRVDGRPNLRACITPLTPGMRVERQNIHGVAGLDPTRVVDHVFSGGLDHHRLMVRPRPLNELMQSMARQLTGLGTVPDHGVEVIGGVEDVAADVVVVGAGRAGRILADTMRARGLEVICVDRDAAPDSPNTPLDHGGTRVFAAYPGEGIVAAQCMRRPDRAGDSMRVEEVLRRYRAAEYVFATGARAPLLSMPNNDLPGVVASTGLARALCRAPARITDDAVVIGPEPFASQQAANLGIATVIPVDTVVRLEGGSRVERVVTERATIATSLVVLASPPAPAHELAVQAGATVRYVDEPDPARRGFVVRTDDDGLAAEDFGPQRAGVWAFGSLAEHRALDDAQTAAERLCTAILARRDARDQEADR